MLSVQVFKRFDNDVWHRPARLGFRIYGLGLRCGDRGSVLGVRGFGGLGRRTQGLRPLV